ncbi:MAG: class 1 fructose-bisphosphatase [Desulfovibrionaceae bacterium]|nr:class 1 fructose-bisphosphatase [Desulfovibrionaceae bacterium]
MPEITVTEHLLAAQMEWSPKATGQFTSLLHDLIVSAKIISRNVKQAGLVDILGGTGEVNVQGERVQKLDEFANKTLVYRMRTCGAVCALGSEELEEPLIIPPEESSGSYIIYFDPLDGSSNIDVNVSIGTIFSIYRRREDATEPFRAERMLRPCDTQVAAGYFLYGPSTMMVYTTGHGVNGFTLDPSIGEFLLSHPNMQIAPRGAIYSVNASYDRFWDEATRECVDSFCHPAGGQPYSLRYVGSLVADFHRTLLYGGIFMYPADTRKPDGKLRLMYEAAPMAFLAEQAGGKATDGVHRILDKTPLSIHERTPLIIGSSEDVDHVADIYRRHGRG